MKEHKTNMNITKCKKMNSTAMTEHKADMSITKNEKYKEKKRK